MTALVENITKDEAIRRVRLSFAEHATVNKGRFLVNKSAMTRSEVVSKLEGIFNNVNIVEGQLSIAPVTVVFTEFRVESRQE